MDDLRQLLHDVGKLGPNGFSFLVVLALFWLNARVEALEQESDDRRGPGR